MAALVDYGCELLVGIDDAPPAPMQMGSPEKGNFRGYEVDLLEEMTQRLGVRMHYRRALWSTIVAELVAGRLDLICSAATVTEERQRQIDFCERYLQLQLAVARAQGEVRSIALANERVGVRQGTTAESNVRKEGESVSIHLSESNENLYEALLERMVDSVVDDSPIASYYSHAIPGIHLVGLVPGTEASYAIMVRKGHAGLRQSLNRVLLETDHDGSLARFRTKWFGSTP